MLMAFLSPGSVKWTRSIITEAGDHYPLATIMYYWHLIVEMENIYAIKTCNE